MARVSRGVTSHRRHKKILKKTRGYSGARSRTYKVAKQAATKAGQYAYRDRRVRKRQFRSLWITRISAACRAHEISYSLFMNALKQMNVQLDRKVLAELAVTDGKAFTALVNQAKQSL